MYRRGIIGVASCVALAAALFAAPDASAALPRTILILDQAAPAFAAHVRVAGALRARLNAPDSPATAIYSEHLDLMMFNGPAYEQTLTNYLRDKYADRDFGLVVAIGGAALDYALRLRASHWSDVPIVFCSIDQRTIQRKVLAPNVTGQTIPLSLTATVDLARALLPDLESVTLVGDPLGGQTFRREYDAELPAIGAKVKVVDYFGLPLGEVTQRVAQLPATSAIVYTALSADGRGAVHHPVRALEIVAERANRPIFVDLENYVGHGALGGWVTLPEVVGTRAAELVQRVLNGEDIARIPVAALPDAIRPVFDWRQLERWGISQSRLPPGSEVRYRNVSFLEQHPWLFVAAASAFLLQSALIIGLVYENRRRRAAEAEARQSLSESAYMSRLITTGALSASIAHEIRQPLAAIVSYGDAGLRWLTNNTPDYAEVRNSLTKIVDQGHRAAAIVDILRALFRKEIEHRTVLDMNSVVRDVFKLTSNELKKNRIVLNTALVMQPRPLVLGDRVQLEQVMLNLIVNAIEAMRSVNAGERILTVKSVVDQDNALRMTIEDSGPGLAPDHADKIFKPYFTTKAGGMGLGLSICKSIVGSHGGQITATSIKDRGTAFHLTFPLHNTVTP